MGGRIVNPFAHPDYPDFPSKTQALKAGVPWARAAARRDACPRTDRRGEIVGLIAGGLELNLGGGGDDDPGRMRQAEALLACFERGTA